MNIKANIWKLYAERSLASSWFITPVLVAFYLANGISHADVFLLQAIFAAVIVVLEIPSGYFSDAVGRRTSLITGAFFLPLSIVFYLIADSFWWFALAEVCMAIGFSIRSGTDSAMLYDTLNELNDEGSYKQKEGTAHLIERLTDSVARISGGFLSTIGTLIPFYVNLVSQLLLIPLAFSIKEPKRKSAVGTTFMIHVLNVKNAMIFCWQHKTLRYAVLYSAAITGINLMGYWAYFLYYNELGISLAIVGIITAITSVFSGFGGKLAYVIEEKFGTKIALCIPLLTVANYFMIANFQSLWILPFIFMTAGLWGYSIPLLRHIMHSCTEDHIRATVLSTSSMIGRVFYIALAGTVGFLVEATSVQTGYYILSAVFAISCSFFAFKLIQQRK